MTWNEAAEIAGHLHTRFPRKDPLTLRFPDLERWIRELTGFSAEGSATPGQLEAIQAAWYARFSHALAEQSMNR